MWPVFLKKWEVVEVAEEGNGVCRIRWNAMNNSLDLTVWFNRETGYAPIRREARYKWYGATPRPQEIAETTWTQISGVWVPKSAMLERTLHTSHTKIDLAFQWESVNQPVLQTVFLPASLLPHGAGALIVSTEAGGPVVLGRVRGM